MDELVEIAREAIPYIDVDDYGLYRSRTHELRIEAAVYLEEILDHRDTIPWETFARSVVAVLSLGSALSRSPALNDLLQRAERLVGVLDDRYEAQRALVELLEARLDASSSESDVSLMSSDSESEYEEEYIPPPPRRPPPHPPRGYRTS